MMSVSTIGMYAEKTWELYFSCSFSKYESTNRSFDIILYNGSVRVGHTDRFITEYERKLKSREKYIYEHMRGEMEVSATPIFFILKNSFFANEMKKNK